MSNKEKQKQEKSDELNGNDGETKNIQTAKNK